MNGNAVEFLSGGMYVITNHYRGLVVRRLRTTDFNSSSPSPALPPMHTHLLIPLLSNVDHISRLFSNSILLFSVSTLLKSSVLKSSF